MKITGTLQSYDPKSQTAKVSYSYMGSSFIGNIPVSKAMVNASAYLVINTRCVIDILDESNPRNAVLAYVY